MTGGADGQVASGPDILLVAPNLSRQMGGEALKALEIHLGLLDLGFRVRQVAHDRVRAELDRDYPQLQVSYIADSRLQSLMSRRGFGPLLGLLNAWQLHRAAQREVRRRPPSLVHFTSPISPVQPYWRLDGAPTVIGPLNGNIAYPPPFRRREPGTKRWTRRVLKPLQAVLGAMFGGKKAALLLVAGGSRTEEALRFGGCSPDKMVETLDSGIAPALLQRPRLIQTGENDRFVFAGRLVDFKGCDLAIRALAATDRRVTLDVIGDGPERPMLELLAADLGIADRVGFLGWFTAGEATLAQFAHYRALVLPSLAEANGIVVQEAMALGLPVIALDWGGPAALLHPDRGMLVPPTDEAGVVAGLAAAMGRLAVDGALADALSIRARAAADAFGWPDVLRAWCGAYRQASSHEASATWPA